MSEEWLFQLRVYLPDGLANRAKLDPQTPALKRLTDILARHDAVLVSQFGAFETYVAEAERNGPDGYPLYRWTKATIEDPAMQAKHNRTFSLHVGGQEVYPKPTADALEVELRPLAGGDLITRMTRHDTNPANNIPVPEEFRSTPPTV